MGASKINKINNSIVNMLFIIAYAMVVFTILGRNNVVSILFSASFLLVFFLWIKAVIVKGLKGIDYVVLSAVVIAFLNVKCNLLLNGYIGGLSYYKKVIMFSSSIIFISLSQRITIDDKTEKRFLYCGVLCTLFIIFMYYAKHSAMYVSSNGLKSNYLIFNMGNPNKTALFLIILFIINFTTLSGVKKFITKALLVINLLFIIKFILETESRNSMFVAICFVTVIIYSRGKKASKKNFCNKLLAFISCEPILFALFYINVIHSKFVEKNFAFLVSEGKNLDSRYTIWHNAFEKLMNSPFFGAYYQISNGTGVSQMHNTHVDVLASYGPLVLILTCIILFLVMKKTNACSSKNKKCIVNLVAFISVIIMGNGEAAILAGGTGLNILSTAFLFFAYKQVSKISTENGIENNIENISD